jgi:hypothetical protein
MTQPPEHLRFELETSHGVRRGEARPHHLERHSAARLILLRLVHGAHPAVADQTQDSVAADAGAEERGLARALRDRPTCGRRLELARRVVGREELQNFVAEVAIGTARAADEALSIIGIALERRFEQLAQAPPAFGFQGLRTSTRRARSRATCARLANAGRSSEQRRPAPKPSGRS